MTAESAVKKYEKPYTPGTGPRNDIDICSHELTLFLLSFVALLLLFKILGFNAEPESIATCWT